SPQGTAAPRPRPPRDAPERDRPREPPQVGAPRRRGPAGLSGILWRAPTDRRSGGLRRRPHPRPARRRAFDRGPMERAAGIAALWLCRHIEEFVELRVEPLEVDVREATGTDPADDRDAMDEGHVVRLPEESNHVRERSLRDDLIESVVEDYAALPFAGHRQDRAERGIEVLRMDRAGDPRSEERRVGKGGRSRRPTG